MSVRDDDVSSQANDGDDEDEGDGNQQDVAVKLPIHTPISRSVVATDMSTDHLTLDEPSTTSTVSTTVASRTIKTWLPRDIRDLKLAAGEELVSKVVMPLSNRFIKDAGRSTFKVLLFRPRNVESDSAIIHKLADAQLAAVDDEHSSSPTTTSKYHVVPDAFGPGSQPSAAAVVPVDYQLETVHYDHASFANDGSRTVLLGDHDNRARTVSIYHPTSARWTVQGAQLADPDLAVILTNDVSESKDRDFARASRTFAERHNIPIIAIRCHNDSPTESQLGFFIRNGLRLDVNATYASGGSLHRTLPIDQKTFLGLDPKQLSRHIFHLMQHRERQVPLGAAVVGSGEKTQVDIEKHAQELPKIGLSGNEKVEVKTIVKGLAVCLALLVYITLLVQGMSAANAKWAYTKDTSAGVEQVNNLTEHKSFASSVVAMITSSKSKSVALATAEPTHIPAGRLKQKFEVEAVGSSHLIVRSAREYPNIEVSVTRQGKQLQTDTRILFPGVWSIRLDAEQAYGDVCVQVLTKRPAINETVLVNLGQQPLDAWFKSLLEETEGKIQQKLTLLQDSLETIQKQERPQQLVKTARTRLFKIIDYAGSVWRSPEWHNYTMKLKEGVGNQSYTIVKGATQMADQASENLQQMSEAGIASSLLLFEHILLGMNQAKSGIGNLDVIGRLDDIRQRIREGPQSETLATAQERAQHLVNELRQRLSKGAA